MNRAFFIGRLTADAETRYSADNKPVVRFRIAVGRRNPRENEPDADFFSCVAFGRTAERMDKCRIAKGTKLYVDGEMRTNEYKDRDGNKRREYEVVVRDFEFMEGRRTDGN